MAKKSTRKSINYFDGVNKLVSANLSKITELSHVENCRSKNIGTIEKRGGFDILGGQITAGANYGLFYFENDNSLSNDFFRISNVSGTVSVYYLNTSDEWTILSGKGTSLSHSQFSTIPAEDSCFLVNNVDDNRYIGENGTVVYSSADLGDSTTQFDIQVDVSVSPSASPSTSISPSVSPSASISPSISPSSSASPSISQSISPSASPTNSVSSSISPSISPSYSPSISPSISPSSSPAATTDVCRYLYDGTGTDPLISTSTMAVGDIIHITASNFNAANKGAFTLTKVGDNFFEVSNASGVAESNKTIGTGVIRINNHLTSSPIANKVNFYKDRLYLADYTDTTRYKTGVMMSSKPLGIVALVDGDHDQPLTELKVTATKYIKSDDVLDIYRGNSKIGTVIVTAKNTDTNTLTIVSFTTDIKSSDEVWIAGTYSGKRMFRWTENPESGVDVKQYDTFKLTGGNNDRIRMITNVGNVMLLANKNSFSVWNDSNLQNFEMGVGCVSDRGFVNALGMEFFIHYTGIYATTGDVPKLISSKVEPYLTGASKSVLENACMGRKGTSVFCAFASTTLYNPDGSVDKVLNDVVLERNLQTENWFIHTGIKAEQFATYPKTSDADALEFSSTESGNQIMTLFTGQRDNKVTEYQNIPFRADTQELLLSDDFEVISYPMEIVVEMERGSAVQCFISLDDEPFYSIQGEARKGATILKVTGRDEDHTTPVRARKLKLSFRDYSSKLCRISRVAIKHSLSNETEEKSN